MSISGSKRPLPAFVEPSFQADKKPRISESVDVINPAEIAFDKINIHKLHSKSLIDQKSVEEFIEKIIRIYNGNRADQADTQGTFQLIPVKAWNPEDHRRFYARFYYAKHPTKSNFAEWLTLMTSADEHKFQGSVVHFINFLYRGPKLKQPNETPPSIWELFALTTYDGFRVVKPFADFHFPIQIASRLIDPTFSVSDSKSLAGHTDSSSETYREGYSLKQHELDSLWKVFKSFQSHFKHPSSLYNSKYKLTAFIGESSNKKLLKRTVKVGVGKINIGGKLTFPQYEAILNHFSKVARGVPIYLDADKKILEQENLSFRYLENIQHVKKELASKLNSALIHLVWKYYTDPRHGNQITFVHKFYKDFYISGEFHLKYKDQDIYWYCRPSLYEVIEILRVWYGTHCNLEQFTACLEATSLKFDRKREFFHLREFFQGEVRYEGELFFRVDSLWLQVKADHMAVLQRSFYELLDEHLIRETAPEHLNKPWLMRKEWIAFTLQEAEEKMQVKEKELKAVIEKLEEQTFSFLDKEGQVICAYPTYCLLDQHPLGASFTKKLLKNWESLTLLLQEKQDKKEPLTQQDLERLFKKDKKAQTHYPQELLKLLSTPYPILGKISLGRVKKISILQENDIPIFLDLSLFTFKKAKKTFQTNQKAIESLLSQSQESQEPITPERIETALSPKFKTYAKNVFDALKEPREAPKTSLYGFRYLIQGPIPPDLEASEEILNYLKEHHRNYRLLAQEEGYNRSYLSENSYLVCDQVYAGKKEQVELFDILYFGQPGKVYLYHVKEGFGQKTREACAQIRVAAVNIQNALNSGNFDILRKIHDEATKEGVKTPFRKNLKKKFEMLPLPEKEGTPASEAFIQLFPENRKKICFVYAFVDSADHHERLLQEEVDPSYEFSLTDFTIECDEKVALQIFESLQQTKLLDEHGRLTSAFMKMTKEKFYQQMAFLHNFAAVYKVLLKKTSQFDSIGAKVELMHTKDFLQGLGFGFKICQIRRGVSTKNGQGTLPSSFEFNSQEWEQIITPDSSFTYENKVYSANDEPYNDIQLLAMLLEHPSNYNEKQLRLKLRELFSDHQSEKEAWIAYFRKFIEKAAEEDLEPKIERLIIEAPEGTFDEKLNCDFENLFKYYLFCLILPNFSLGREEWELAARFLDTKVVLLPRNPQANVQVENSEEIHAEGSQSLLLVKEGTGYYPTQEKNGSALSRQSQKTTPSTSRLYSEVLSDEEKEQIMTGKCSSGLQNLKKTDCFFNSAVQLILHSPPLLNYLMDEDNLEQGVNNSKEFFSFLKELVLEYSLFSNFSDSSPITSYPRQAMRQLLALSLNNQEDAVQVFSGIFKYYKLENLLSKFNTCRDPNLNKLKETNKDPNKYTSIDVNNHVIAPYTEVALLLPLSEKFTSFQDTVDALFQPSQVDDSYCFIQGDKVMQTSDYRQKLEVKQLRDFVFFHVGKFDMAASPKVKNIEITKKHQSLHPIVNGEFKIQHTIYQLEGFIIHIGPRPTEGHYIAYCKNSGVWVCYDDEKNPQQLDEKEALQQAQSAYFLYFKKKMDQFELDD
jgi:ubiquitin C-terminal hydrolase